MKQKFYKLFVLLPLLFIAIGVFAQSSVAKDAPTYEGENKKGTPEGQGVMKWGNDATFEGTFHKGNPVQGKLSLYKNGNLVEEMTGTFNVAKHKGNLMPSDISVIEGKGVIKWDNGATFEGTYTWLKKEKDIMEGTLSRYKDGKLVEETTGTFIVEEHEGKLMPSDFYVKEGKGVIKWGNEATFTWEQKEGDTQFIVSKYYSKYKGILSKYKDGKLIEETKGSFTAYHKGELSLSDVVADGPYTERRCYGPDAPYIYAYGSFRDGRIGTAYVVCPNCVVYGGQKDNQNGKLEFIKESGLYKKFEPGTKKVYVKMHGEERTRDWDSGEYKEMVMVYFPELILRKYQDYAKPEDIKNNLGSGLIPSPDQKSFVQTSDIQWSGEIKDGKINGKGYGVYNDLNDWAKENWGMGRFDPKKFRYVYLEGTFVDGVPVGKVKYQIYEEGEFKNITANGYDNLEFGKAFVNGMKSLVVNGKYGFVDKDYKFVISPQFLGVVSAFNAQGQAVVKNEKGEEIVIDQTGKNLGYSDHQKYLFAEADRKEKQKVRDNDLNYVAGIVNAKDRNYYPNSTSFTRRPLDDIESAIKVCGKYSDDKAFLSHRNTLEKLKTTETANYKKASAEHDKYMVAYRESQARERESRAREAEREAARKKAYVDEVEIVEVRQPDYWDKAFENWKGGRVKIYYRGKTLYAYFIINCDKYGNFYSWFYRLEDVASGLTFSFDDMMKEIKEKVVLKYYY